MKLFLKIVLFVFMLGSLCEAQSIFGKYLGIDDDSIYWKNKFDRIFLATTKKNNNISNKKQTMEKLNDLLKNKSLTSQSS